MKYLLTIINDESKGGMDLPPEEMKAAMEPWNRYNRELLDAGAFVSGEPLHPSASATTVHHSDEGEQTVTDGPFAETKEQLGGFYLLECADLDEALGWAKKVPVRPGNSVEVRPALDLSEFRYEDPYVASTRA